MYRILGRPSIANLVALISATAAIVAAKEAWDATIFDREAILVNTCEARFHHVGEFPKWVGILGTASTFAIPVSELPVYSAKGDRFRPPDYYIECRLENFGKVPALGITYHIHFGSGLTSATPNDLLVQADAVPQDRGTFEYALVKGVQDPIHVAYTHEADFADVGSRNVTSHYVSVQERLDSIEVEFMPPDPQWQKNRPGR